jgi:hypothetical protein
VLQSASVWTVLLLAVFAANLPFLNERLLGIAPRFQPAKSLAIRLAELVLLYFGVGGVGMLLEGRAGQLTSQGWEFYAITAALFVVLSFPGFTWRYLLKHRH